MNEPYTEVFINETFPIALDGIGNETKMCLRGEVTEIPSRLVEQLRKVGKVSIGDDVPVVDDEVPASEETDDSDVEYTVDYFVKQGREAMLQILEDEELEGDESDTQLAQLCVEAFLEE